MYHEFTFEQMSEAFKRLHAEQEENVRLRSQNEEMEYSLRTMAQRLQEQQATPEEQEARLVAMREARQTNNKIGMIKVLRSMTKLGLKESKDLVEVLTGC